MPVYDDQNQDKNFIDKIRQKRGVDPDVLARPKKGTGQNKSDDLKALENNQEKINQDLGIGKEQSFTNANGQAVGIAGKLGFAQKIKGFVSNNPKKSAGLGITAGLSIGVVAIGLIGLGPLKLMQFANLLQGIHFSDGDVVSSRRIKNLVTYSKWLSNPDAAGIENTRLGTVESFRAKKIDAKLADAGIKSNFDKFGKFTGFDIDESKMPKDIQDIKDPEKKKLAYAKHFDIDPKHLDIGGDGIKINAPDGTRSIRKLQFQALKISPNINKATAAYSKRLLYKRANITYNPITRVKQAAKEKFLKKVEQYKEQRQARYEGKDINLDVPKNQADEADGDSKDVKDNKSTYNNTHSDAEDTVKNIGDTSDVKTTKSMLKSKIAGGGGALVVIGILCTTQQMSGDIADAQLDNKLSAMINAGSEMLSIESKIKTGQDLDYETIGMAANSLEATKNAGQVDEEGNLVEGASAVAGSAFDASTIQKWQGKETKNRDLDNPNISDANPDNKALAQQLDSVFDGISNTQGVGQTLNAVCGVYNAIDGFSGALVNIATFGLSDKVSAMMMGPIFNLLTGDAVNALADKYKGAAFGEMASMGFLLMQNETNSSMGQDVLSSQQRAELNKYVAEETNAQDSRSFIAKNMDLSNPYGLASETVVNVSTFQPSQIIDSPKAVLNNLSSIFSGKSKAETAYSLTDEDTYGIPKVSIPPALLENPDFENPFKNAIEAKKIIAANPELKDYVQKCRGIEISDDLNFTTKSKDDGGLASYMKKDCKSEAYMAYSLDNQLLNKGSTNNIASLFGNLFGQKAVAAQTSAPLTEKQRQYAVVMFAATDTTLAKSYSCIEEGDDQSCAEIFPEEKSETACQEPGDSQKPPDDYEKVAVGSNLINKRTQFMINQAEEVSGVKLTIAQGSYCNEAPQGCAALSAGTHDGGGVVDFSGSSLNKQDINKAIKGLRTAGFAAWFRDWPGNQHIHAVAIGDKDVAAGAKAQIQNYIDGLDGLKGSAPDPHKEIGVILPPWAKEYVKGGKVSDATSNSSCSDGVIGSKDYTDDTANPIPKGEEVAQQAIRWAENDPRCSFHPGGCYRACLGIVSDLWKSVGKGLVSGGTAWEAYQRYKSNGWVNKTKDIPVGAIMWSANLNDPGAGHAYTYVGDGKIASNDVEANGKYSIVPADWIETKWNHTFLGWSEWHN